MRTHNVPRTNNRLGGITGRAQALAALDNLMRACQGREKRFAIRLQTEFDKDPVRFFREIVMPLIPRRSAGFRDPAGAMARRSAAGGKGGAR
jgi:hypothetical protein